MMPADEAAIRAAYALKDACYARRDLVRLAATDLPTFSAVDIDGTAISHAQIWSYMRVRMARQTSCQRRERPVRIVVSGRSARVEVSTTDDFTLRTKTGVRRRVERLHGWSDWRRTPQGWRQAKLRFDRSEWRDAKGVWRRA